ncbi:MAG: glycosyltransferase family 2 protein [Clostridia bacterium]|nr:glycosyltransferase family 2 protein [Clostridia bacterium]
MYSIIMPTYNCEKYVLSAIESVLSQTYSDFELIVVDDQSTDDTFAIISNLTKQDSRIKSFQVSHGGVSLARNFGIEKATGDKILFIDGDDSWEQTLLESCEKIKSDLCIFGIIHDFYNGGVLVNNKNQLFNIDSQTKYNTKKDLDLLLSEQDLASPCNKVYNKNIIDKFGVRFCSNCVYLEDLKFNLDYLQHVERVCVLPKNLYHYRLNICGKQVLKRAFKDDFVNANELYFSAERLLKKIESNFCNQPTLTAVLLKAYYTEFCALIYRVDIKQSKGLLDQLNKNIYYRCLLKFSKGKFYFVLKVLKIFNLKTLQIKMIKKRFW